MIYGEISSQRLKLINEHVVSDTINYLEVAFRFKTDDWDGLEKWAHFARDSEVYDIRLTDDHIRKEDHLNLSAGKWKVYIHGNEFREGEVVQRITTNMITLYVEPTGTLDGEPFPEIPASVTEQILARLDDVEQNGGGGGDGYSPEAKVERVEGGVRVTIADKNGTTSEVVQDGKSGVHVGNDAPPAGTRVWVNPNGKRTEIPQVDDTLSKTGYAADAAAVGEALKKQSNAIADKLDANKLPEAINTALAQAKESGEFDGKPGAPGDDYVLTETDKREIAELVGVPEGGEYRLLKTITIPEATQRISESWGEQGDGKGYDGVVVTFDNISGIENTNGLTVYASIGSPQTVVGVGAALKNNQVMRLVARKLNGLWDIFGSYGEKEGASTMLGQTGCAHLYSTAPHNATPDGYRFSWNKISRALFYTFAESLPVGMTIKIFVLGGEENA